MVTSARKAVWYEKIKPRAPKKFQDLEILKRDSLVPSTKPMRIAGLARVSHDRSIVYVLDAGSAVSYSWRA